jgi:hypothetical protein
MIDIFDESSYPFLLTISCIKYLTVTKAKNKLAPKFQDEELKK